MASKVLNFIQSGSLNPLRNLGIAQAYDTADLALFGPHMADQWMKYTSQTDSQNTTDRVLAIAKIIGIVILIYVIYSATYAAKKLRKRRERK